MTDHFDRAFARLMGVEGDYYDDPNGGATRWGVTEAIARRHGYKGDMGRLPKTKARDIAKAEFWDVMRLDEVAELSEKIAGEVFDTGYNAGPGRAARFLQTALNAFNRSDLDQPEWPEVRVDGDLGPATLAALKAAIELDWPAGGEPEDAMELILFRALNSQQGVHYLNLASARKRDEAVVRGWFLNRVE